jgi:hypothetical protein
LAGFEISRYRRGTLPSERAADTISDAWRTRKPFAGVG